jgi:hypothetical protein
VKHIVRAAYRQEFLRARGASKVDKRGRWEAWDFCSMGSIQGFDAGKAALEQNLGILEEEMVSGLRNEMHKNGRLMTICSDSGDDEVVHTEALTIAAVGALILHQREQ